MTIAPDKPKTEPMKIPDTLPPLDDPFWKPYRDKPDAPPKESPGGPGGPNKPPKRPTKT